MSDLCQKLSGSLLAHLPIRLAGCPSFPNTHLPLCQGWQHLQGCWLHSGWLGGPPRRCHPKGPQHRRVMCQGTFGSGDVTFCASFWLFSEEEVYLWAYPVLSLRKIQYLRRGLYALNMPLYSSLNFKEHVEMTQNAIACLEECYFLNHNLASNRALDFAWIFFFLFSFFYPNRHSCFSYKYLILI